MLLIAVRRRRFPQADYRWTLCCTTFWCPATAELQRAASLLRVARRAAPRPTHHTRRYTLSAHWTGNVRCDGRWWAAQAQLDEFRHLSTLSRSLPGTSLFSVDAPSRAHLRNLTATGWTCRADVIARQHGARCAACLSRLTHACAAGPVRALSSCLALISGGAARRRWAHKRQGLDRTHLDGLRFLHTPHAINLLARAYAAPALAGPAQRTQPSYSCPACLPSAFSTAAYLPTSHARSFVRNAARGTRLGA